MNSYCVLVEHCQGSDWALVLAASRTGERRYFTPFLFTCDSAGLFAACPNADIWARLGKLRVFKTHRLAQDVRGELLKNAVSDLVSQIKSISNVLEHTRAGLLNKVKALGYNEALPNFSLDDEPAFRWLYDHKDGEPAVNAMRICRYLVDKHGIGRLSLEELEQEGTRRILKGR